MNYGYPATSGVQFVLMVLGYLALSVFLLFYVGGNKLFFSKSADENIIEEPSQEPPI